MQSALMSRYMVGVGEAVGSGLAARQYEKSSENLVAGPIDAVRVAAVRSHFAGEPDAESIAAAAAFVRDHAAFVEDAAEQAAKSEVAAEVLELTVAARPDEPAAQRDARRGMRLGVVRGILQMPEPQRELLKTDASVWRDNLLDDLGLIEAAHRDGQTLSADEAERLIDRHGWFGELTAAAGLAEGSALHERTQNRASSRAVRTMVGTIVGVGVAALAMLAGIGLFIAALYMATSGRVITSRFEAERGVMPAARRVVFLETFVLFLVGFLALSAVLPMSGSAVARTAALWSLLLLAFWPLVRGVPMREWRLGMGWHANGGGLAGVAMEAAKGVVGYLAGLPIILVGVLITLGLVALTDGDASHPIAERASGDVFNALSLLLMAAAWAPIVEETFFRGALYYNVRGVMSAVPAGLLVGFVFAAIHPQGLAAVPALMSIALVFSLLREWRGSLVAPIVMHAVHNGFIVTLLLVTIG
jgi:membrane protease YdiL (CAAX protease family)